MAVQDLVEEVGRKPIEFIELDLPICVNVIRNAPCTANPAVGSECYNTFNTCQDPDNFVKGTRTYRFVSPNYSISGDPIGKIPSITGGFVDGSKTFFIPSLIKIGQRSSMLKLGSGFSTRAKVTIRLQDGPDEDLLTDPYYSTRGTTADQRLATGTFWGKLHARLKFFSSKIVVRVYRGYEDDLFDYGNFRVEEYNLETISLPDNNGVVEIVAKDKLRLAEDKRAKAPTLSDGKLLTSIDDVTTTATLTPSGIGDSDYPASGKARIGSEVVSFTRSSDTLTITRGILNTDAESHDAGETVQICLEYSAQTVPDVIDDLLLNYTNNAFTTADRDKAAWDAENDLWASDLLVSTVITEPTSVNSLIQELAEISFANVWFDPVSKKVEFDIDSPPLNEVVKEYKDNGLIKYGRITVEDDEERRNSQVYVFFGQIDPTEDLEDRRNYAVGEARINLDAEGPNQWDETTIKTIFTRWLSSSQAAVAGQLAGRYLNRYRNNIKVFKFKVDAENTPSLSEQVKVSTHNVQTVTGENASVLTKVTSVQFNNSMQEYEVETEEQAFVNRYFILAPNADAGLDYDSATEDQKLSLGFLADASGTVGSLDDLGYVLF